MKQVVQEVLKGNKTIISNKSNRPGRQQTTGRSNQPARQQSNRTNPVSARNNSSALQNIKRPNYQQLKKDQRLSAITGRGSNRQNLRSPNQRVNRPVSPRQGNTNTPRSSNSTVLPKRYNQDSVSRLSSLTLSQGKVPTMSHSAAPANRQRTSSAKVIGKTKNGGTIWFFPDVEESLLNNFNRPLNNSSIGVVEMPDCLPSYLLLINDVIRNNQEMKFYISWDKEGNTPFLVELYNDDANKLESIMNDIYQKINRRSLKQSETYTASSPSSWLSKQLNINSSVDSIAFLEGVPYYNSVILMDNLLKNERKNDFDYEINSNYLLLTGNYHVVSNLITELKKEADRM